MNCGCYRVTQSQTLSEHGLLAALAGQILEVKLPLGDRFSITLSDSGSLGNCYPVTCAPRAEKPGAFASTRDNTKWPSQVWGDPSGSGSLCCYCNIENWALSNAGPFTILNTSQVDFLSANHLKGGGSQKEKFDLEELTVSEDDRGVLSRCLEEDKTREKTAVPASDAINFIMIVCKIGSS